MISVEQVSSVNMIKDEKILDIESVKSQFPILQNGWIYLDSAATTQKPSQVIDALATVYREYNANTHRGAYRIAEKVTAEFEQARKKIQNFIGAADRKEIVFVRGTTEAINTVAMGYGNKFLKSGDEIIFTEMEHHSNIVPWQMLSKRTGASLKLWPFESDGRLLLEKLDQLITPKTRILALTHISNTLGTINPVKEIAGLAHQRGVKVVVDAAQSIPHMPVNVSELDVDFLAFSGHKMCGPTGIGILYAKQDLLDSMDPVQYGGDMIESVDFMESTWNELPWKFEGGTQNIAGAIGLGAAVDYLSKVGLDAIYEHEKALIQLALQELESMGVQIYGPKENRGAAITFNLGSLHAHDVATFLDHKDIAIRSGHHCAQLVMKKLGVPATARISFYLYNTKKDVEAFITALAETRETFKKWL